MGISRVTGRFEAAAHHLAPIVGRAQEIALLTDLWGRAANGAGQAAMLSGEAGVGKSRVVAALREHVEQHGANTVLISCSTFHTNDAFHPIIAWLSREIELLPDDGPVARTAKFSKYFSKLSSGPASIFPASIFDLAMLLGAADNLSAEPEDAGPDERKRRIYEAVTSVILAKAVVSPLFVIVEDTHWIDPSSQILLENLSARLGNHDAIQRVLVLMTTRPESDKHWDDGAGLTYMALDRLDKSGSEALIDNVTGGRALPPEVHDEILAKTDGVPLFVEELTKTVLESDLIGENDGRFVLTGPLSSLAIPASLQDSLMARLDRLGPVKEVAQLASVLGRTFRQRVLAMITPLDAGQLDAAVGRLIDAELVFQRAVEPEIFHEFKHALVQEGAYASLLKSTRQRFHAEVADAMEREFPEIVASEPGLVARHLTEAGDALRAGRIRTLPTKRPGCRGNARLQRRTGGP